MLLKDILYKVSIEAVKGSTDVAIQKIEFDSRKVQENDVFVAIRGTVSDGHEFIEKAISQGAAAIVCEQLPVRLHTAVSYIKVKNSSEAMGLMAAAFYNHPSKKLKLTKVLT